MAVPGDRAVPVGQGALWCERSGPTAPDLDPVVLIHGFSLDRSMWAPQIATLAERHPTIAYDLRGFGRSTPPHPGFDHADDLLALLDALDVRRAHVVGLSLGANVALAAAARAPGRMRSLVLASPGLPGLQWRGERPPDAAAAVARAEGIEAARLFWLHHPLFAPARASSEVRGALERMVGAFAGLQWGDGPASRPLPDLVDAIASIETPALVVSGTLDIDGYREIAHLLAARLPGASLVEIPGAGHLVSMERPDAFNEAVLGYVGGAAAARVDGG